MSSGKFNVGGRDNIAVGYEQGEWNHSYHFMLWISGYLCSGLTGFFAWTQTFLPCLLFKAYLFVWKFFFSDVLVSA